MCICIHTEAHIYSIYIYICIESRIFYIYIDIHIYVYTYIYISLQRVQRGGSCGARWGLCRFLFVCMRLESYRRAQNSQTHKTEKVQRRPCNTTQKPPCCTLREACADAACAAAFAIVMTAISDGALLSPLCCTSQMRLSKLPGLQCGWLPSITSALNKIAGSSCLRCLRSGESSGGAATWRGRSGGVSVAQYGLTDCTLTAGRLARAAWLLYSHFAYVTSEPKWDKRHNVLLRRWSRSLGVVQY